MLPGRRPQARSAALVVGTPAPALERLASDLPSRTAENLFWLGRYTERLEQLLRALPFGHGLPRRRIGQWPARGLGGIAASAQVWQPTCRRRTGSRTADCRQDLLALLYEEDRSPGARRSAQAHPRRQLQRARPAFRRHLAHPEPAQRLTPASAPGHLPLVLAGSVLNTLVLDLAAFSGMEMENMTRGHGWVFLDLGRRIERGIAMARLVEAAIARAAGRASCCWSRCSKSPTAS